MGVLLNSGFQLRTVTAMAKIRLFDVICTVCTGGMYLIWKQILED